MNNFYKIFFFLMMPLILVAQESSEVREMTEDETKDYRENHYCVVTNTKGKFTGLETDVMSLLVTISPEEGEDFESEQISYTLNGEECKGIFLEAISRIE